MGFIQRLLAAFGGLLHVELSTDLESFHVETDEDRALANRVGYMDEQVARLRRIAEALVKDQNLQQELDGTTHCNLAVYRFCRQFNNYNGFYDERRKDILLANEMWAIMNGGAPWTKVEGRWAAEYAASGGLALAAQQGQPHGHVCIVSPSPMRKSPTWGKDVPMVYNVGSKRWTGHVRASEAFQTEPDYFVYREVVS